MANSRAVGFTLHVAKDGITQAMGIHLLRTPNTVEPQSPAPLAECPTQVSKEPRLEPKDAVRKHPDRGKKSADITLGNEVAQNDPNLPTVAFAVGRRGSACARRDRSLMLQARP